MISVTFTNKELKFKNFAAYTESQIKSKMHEKHLYQMKRHNDKWTMEIEPIEPMKNERST